MRYWWVNQNQTYRHEISGAYLWSPKRTANGARNPFYEAMREVSPGDLVFSFVGTRILAIGIAQSYCCESPKPLELGVQFTQLLNKVRPKDHIEIMRPLLPERYAPLQPNGNGLQSVYLTELPAVLAEVLMGLIGEEVTPISAAGRHRDGRPRRMGAEDRTNGNRRSHTLRDRSGRNYPGAKGAGALQGAGEPN
jgi:hypothetical protein